MAPLTATLYDWLLLGHLLGAMIWFGGLLVLVVLGSQAARGGDPDAVARFVGSLRRVGPITLAPAAGALLVFGIWLVVDSEAWDFGQTWVWLGLALFAGAFAIGAVFLSRTGIGAERAVAAGDLADAVRLVRRWTLGVTAILVLLLAATWDMVFKPGL